MKNEIQEKKGRRRSVFVLLVCGTVLAAAVALIVVCASLVGGGWPFAEVSELSGGSFTEELRVLCDEAYGLRIPSDAVLSAGYFENALRDSDVVIVFEIPASSAEHALERISAEKYKQDGTVDLSVMREQFGEQFSEQYVGGLVYEGDTYDNGRYLFYSEVRDGAVGFCLCAPQVGSERYFTVCFYNSMHEDSDLMDPPEL